MKPEVTLPDGTMWKNDVLVEEKTRVAESLDEFRAAHRYNMLDANVRAFAAEVPIFVQWDDHEVTNNWSLSKKLGPQYHDRSILDLAAHAGRAFHEMYPLRESIVEPGRVYRTIQYGPLLDVFMLDERSYRGPNGPNDQTDYGPGAYFLGPDQMAWLKRELLASRATWKVIASDMPLSLIVWDDAEHNVGSEAFAQGDGPPRGRELEIADLLRFIKAAGDPQHRLAHRRRALHGRPPLRPEPGAVPGFRPVLGVRLRSDPRRNLRAERTRQHVRARGALHQSAAGRAEQPSPLRRATSSSATSPSTARPSR